MKNGKFLRLLWIISLPKWIQQLETLEEVSIWEVRNHTKRFYELYFLNESTPN